MVPVVPIIWLFFIVSSDIVRIDNPVSSRVGRRVKGVPKGRGSNYGSEGRGFESLRARQRKSSSASNCGVFSFFLSRKPKITTMSLELTSMSAGALGENFRPVEALESFC